MITYTITGALCKDATLVRVKDRDYLNCLMNASRPKEDAIWVEVMYLTREPARLQEYLKKGAKLSATGTRYTDKIYEGKNGPTIERTLWADDLQIVAFAASADVAPTPAPASRPAPATENQNADDLPF